MKMKSYQKILKNNQPRFRISMIFFVAVFVFSCEDNTNTDPVVGNWELTSALISADTPLGTTNIDIPADTDITELLAEAFYSVAECSSLSQSAIQLSPNNTLHVICKDDATKHVTNGTWIRNSATTMSLNILKPQALSLSISELKITSTTISGTIGLPLTKQVYSELLAPLDVSGSDFPAVILLTVDLNLTRVN